MPILGSNPTPIEYPIEQGNVLVTSGNGSDAGTAPQSTSTAIMNAFGPAGEVFIEIARCESTTRQFDAAGRVLRGTVVPQDVGILQINETYHLKEAERLGYDIYTLEGNLEFGAWLYHRDGLAPWSASKDCWSIPSHQLSLEK